MLFAHCLFAGLLLSVPNADQLSANPLIQGTDFERVENGTFYTGKRFEKELLESTLKKYGHPAITVYTEKGKISEVVFSAKEKAPQLTQEVLDENKNKEATRENLESLSADVQFTLNWTLCPLDAVNKVIEGTEFEKKLTIAVNKWQGGFIQILTRPIPGLNFSRGLGSNKNTYFIDPCIQIKDAKVLEVNTFIITETYGDSSVVPKDPEDIPAKSEKTFAKYRNIRFSKKLAENIINDFRGAVKTWEK